MKNKPEENSRETVSIRQPFLPKPEFFKERDEVLALLEGGVCGRFKLPISFFDRLRFQASAYFERNDPLKKDTFVFSPGPVPFLWQIIARYLHREGITSTPHFLFPDIPNDKPKLCKTRLYFQYDHKKTDGRDVTKNSCSSTALSFDEAFSKTVGEVLERYVFTIYKQREFVRASFSALSGRSHLAFPISRYNRFFDWQRKPFPYLGGASNQDISWVCGEELLSNRKAFIPAQLVFWNYDRTNPEEPVLVSSTTSGGGGYFSDIEAILASLYENIERDAFFVHWFNRAPPPIIDVTETKNLQLSELLQKLLRYKLKAYFLNTTNNTLVPSCICVLADEFSTGGPRLNIGAGTGFDAEQVLVHALLEAMAASNIFESGKVFQLPSSYKPFLHNNIGREERLLLWQGKRMCKEFSFFLRGEQRALSQFVSLSKSFPSKKAELAYVLSIFGNLGPGYEVFCYRARHKILDALGYHVVKTIVPKLFPLYLAEHVAALDSDRIEEVRERFGWEKKERPPWPHPFP